MIYHLHLTESELLAVQESLRTRMCELDELKAETLKNPDGYTNDLLKIYNKKQNDMRLVMEMITIIENA